MDDRKQVDPQCEYGASQCVLWQFLCLKDEQCLETLLEDLDKA